MLKGYLTKKDLAQMLGVHVNTITREIKRGRLIPDVSRPKTYIHEENKYVTSRIKSPK